MKELTDEGKFLLNYCLESEENTRLALEIGRIIPQLERGILSSFLRKLDESVQNGITCDDLRWRTCIPKQDLTEEDLKEPISILYVMTLEYREKEIEIHIGIWNWDTGNRDRVFYVGTHEKREGREVYWPANRLQGFLKKPGISPPDCPGGADRFKRHWRFHPPEYHSYINTTEALSTLNDGPMAKYFASILVDFAKAISGELGSESAHRY